MAAMMRKSQVNAVKQDFARLTLGMFATSFPSFPMTFTYVAEAQAPEGKADVLDEKGPSNFSVRLLINSQTHLPIMLSWQVPATMVTITTPGQPAPTNIQPGAVVVEGPPLPPATATQEDRDKYAKAVADLRKKALAEA